MNIDAHTRSHALTHSFTSTHHTQAQIHENAVTSLQPASPLPASSQLALVPLHSLHEEGHMGTRPLSYRSDSSPPPPPPGTAAGHCPGRQGASPLDWALTWFWVAEAQCDASPSRARSHTEPGPTAGHQARHTHSSQNSHPLLGGWRAGWAGACAHSGYTLTLVTRSREEETYELS